MNLDAIDELQARIGRLEDESAIMRLILSYGPAADAGATEFAGKLWLDDGAYDWDADATPLEGGAAIEAMLQGDTHQGLIADGVAHFAGPLLIDVDGDEATALNYSLIMRRDGDRFFLWRVSAVRWDLAKVDGSVWRVRKRSNRLLDETGGGRRLFGDTLSELFQGVAQ